MRFKGFIGPSYTLQSVNVDCQRSVNLYPEINEAGTGKEGEVVHLSGTPGLKTLISIGEGPIRCVHVTPSGIILVVSKNRLYKVSYNTVSGTWSSTLYATAMNVNTPVVRATSTIGAQEMVSGSPFTEEMVVFVGGDQEYLWRRYNNSGTITETFQSFSTAGYKGAFALEPYVGSYGGSHVALIDGYRIYNKLYSGKFYVSDLDSPTVDPLSFFTAEGDPDNLLAVIDNYRDLWLFGERTTEIWQSSGDMNAPFIRAASGFLEIGCFARYSPATIAGSIVWLGRNKEGRGIVYMTQGYQPKRVSTHAVEFAINSYANPENAVAYTYQEGGHFFYVLNFDEGTWVFDISTGLWHERARLDSGEFKRHRANVYSFAPTILGGIHLVGDFENGNLYQMNQNFYTDDDTEIVRLRTAPHVTAGLKRLRHKSIQLDMETGVGLDGNDQGSDPQCILDWSDDGGHTWSNEHWASIGKIGQFKRRALWRRLGISRDRVYRTRITDKVKIVLIGAEIDVEQEQS
jgi:hypothetical protein